MDKTWLYPMTQRQSNNEWRGSIVVHPAPKNSDCKNLLQKFSPRFFGIKIASSSLIIFQRAKLSTWSITHLCWCNWRTFWRKNAEGKSPRGFWASNALITHPISGSGPVGLPPVSWTEKIIERSRFFVQCRGHCCHGDLVGRTTFWIFCEQLAKVRAMG